MINLLINPSFGGSHHRAPQPFSGEFPDGWELEWYYRDSDPVLGTGTRWSVPELIVVEYLKQFPGDHLRYDKSDDWILKCFKQDGAAGFGWRQTVPDLPSGRYRFICPVFPDHWHRTASDVLVRPSLFTSADWYLASEVDVRVMSGSAPTSSTGWLDARYVPIGFYTPLTVDHDHPGGDLMVRFAARGRWPFKNNGWFFDGLSLERIDVPEPEPAPEPAPEPLPVPDPVPLPAPQPGTLDAVISSIEQLAVDYNSLAQAIGGMNALAQQILVDIANARQMVAKLKSEIAP